MKPKKLSAYLYEYKLPYLFAICSIVVSVSLDLMSPQLTKRIIDEVIVGGETYKLKYLLAGILGIGIGRCIFQYVKEYTFDATVYCNKKAVPVKRTASVVENYERAMPLNDIV